MSQIGIRELREGLSRALRRVRAGETIEVTDRGRPVARIVPVASSIEGLEGLIDAGQVHPPRRTDPRPAPLDLPSSMTSEEAIDVLR
jgi:prevent-host-death family protein